MGVATAGAALMMARSSWSRFSYACTSAVVAPRCCRALAIAVNDHGRHGPLSVGRSRTCAEAVRASVAHIPSRTIGSRMNTPRLSGSDGSEMSRADFLQAGGAIERLRIQD